MSNYFFDMIPKEEFERIPYLPTMGEFVNWFTREYADMPALSDQTNTIKYKEFGVRVARRRAYIEGLGLPKGSHIGIFDRNSQDAIELFLAVTSAGYVAMNLPASLPETALIGSCMKFDIAALFVREEFMPLTAKLQGVKVLPGRCTELLTVQEMAGFQMILCKCCDACAGYLAAKSDAPYWTCIG